MGGTLNVLPSRSTTAATNAIVLSSSFTWYVGVWPYPPFFGSGFQSKRVSRPDEAPWREEGKRQGETRRRKRKTGYGKFTLKSAGQKYLNEQKTQYQTNPDSSLDNDVQLVMYFETSRRARLVAGADTSHVEVSEWKVAPSKPPKDIP
jgi:hypothetical protein